MAGEVGLVDLRTGQWVRPPTVGHTGSVLRLSYAADGLTFATSGHDGRVSLWDGRTGALIGTVLPGRPNEWATVEFLPDGHILMIASRDGQVFTWDTRLAHWVEFACAVAGRNLTDGEWRAAFGDRPYRATCATG
jgi:WD40 repeat protein